MRRHRTFIVSALFLLLLSTSHLAFAQTLNCDSNFVSFNNNVVLVNPTGMDDTANIQCALDFANDNGVPTAKLSNGAFSISSLEVEGFNGSFEGTTKAGTIVVVLDGSVDCVGMNAAGRTDAAIRFISGEPRIRFMSLFADFPCFSPGDNIRTLVHFTGQDANAPCGNDVIFGNVDRMIFEGSSPSAAVDTGVAAWAEGHIFDTCRDTLTGTLKVNRAEFRNMQRGVVTSMQAAAQVDVNFNIFESTVRGYEMQRSNQNTSVAFNNFTGTATSVNPNYFSIVANSPGAGNPATTSITVKGNTFTLSSENQFAAGFFSFFEDSNSSLTSVFTDNTFFLDQLAEGIAGRDISNGTIANNRFIGTANVAIEIGQIQSGVPPTAEDWTVVGNTFTNLQSSLADVFLATTSNRCIVGPGQTSSVTDLGTNNFLLTNP